MSQIVIDKKVFEGDGTLRYTGGVARDPPPPLSPAPDDHRRGIYAGGGNADGPPMIATNVTTFGTVIGVAGVHKYTLFRYILDTLSGTLPSLTPIWSMPTNDPSGATSSTFYDTPSGPRIYYADAERLWVFGVTGAVLDSQPATSGTLIEDPVIAAFDSGSAPGRVIVAASNYQTLRHSRHRHSMGSSSSGTRRSVQRAAIGISTPTMRQTSRTAAGRFRSSSSRAGLQPATTPTECSSGHDPWPEAVGLLDGWAGSPPFRERRGRCFSPAVLVTRRSAAAGGELAATAGRGGLPQLHSAGQDLQLIAVSDGALAEVAARLTERPQAAVALHTP